MWYKICTWNNSKGKINCVYINIFTYINNIWKETASIVNFYFDTQCRGVIKFGYDIIASTGLVVTGVSILSQALSKPRAREQTSRNALLHSLSLRLSLMYCIARSDYSHCSCTGFETNPLAFNPAFPNLLLCHISPMSPNLRVSSLSLITSFLKAFSNPQALCVRENAPQGSTLKPVCSQVLRLERA